MKLTHWNYFIAIERDVIELSRYIEFDKSNFKTFSIEIARILMASTQEIDVLFKQICQKHGDSSDNEAGYRALIPQKYPKIITIKVELSMHNLNFVPFEDWEKNTTPSWWTANNKVKHQRHTHFNKASLENMLDSLCGLMVANLYYYEDILEKEGIFPGAKLLYPIDLVDSVSPTTFGMVPNYRLP